MSAQRASKSAEQPASQPAQPARQPACLASLPALLEIDNRKSNSAASSPASQPSQRASQPASRSQPAGSHPAARRGPRQVFVVVVVVLWCVCCACVAHVLCVGIMCVCVLRVPYFVLGASGCPQSNTGDRKRALLYSPPAETRLTVYRRLNILLQ